jgi:hypothetical protein
MSSFSVKKLTTQISKFKPSDIWPLFELVLSFVPGKIYKIIHPHTWIVTEYENDARDNGYWFFKYVREEHPEQRIFYPINYQASDFKKVGKLGNTIKFGSFMHYMLFWGCEKFIGTTKYYGLPYGRICDDLVHWGVPHFKYVFLNHGVARGYSSIVDAKETNYQMIVSMSELEKKIIIEENGQKSDIIQTIGFCRHDNLNAELLNKKEILIMPTWRNWLDARTDFTDKSEAEIKHDFLQSDYYKRWYGLISSDSFLEFLQKNDLKAKFYLHEYAEKYTEFFKTDNPNIIITKKADSFVQDLLKEAAILITDYSSVSYDFAYMSKPVFYYQFDLEDFEAKQYKQGKYYSYKENGFGEILFDEDNLIEAIKHSYTNNFELDHKYLQRVNDFFAHQDNKNSERNYIAVKNL